MYELKMCDIEEVMGSGANVTCGFSIAGSDPWLKFDNIGGGRFEMDTTKSSMNVVIDDGTIKLSGCGPCSASFENAVHLYCEASMLSWCEGYITLRLEG